ncbi:acetoacetate decarboxylase family protein [Streptomyces sp. NPDC057363]|uniref:acetoacetate decarboxylase family protein n=1 Tax=Streptomyces sp. NPDC057363 TaxID=3346107 RepID=UPI003645B41C
MESVGAVVPPYPEPPWDYVNASILNIVARVGRPENLDRFLAPGVSVQEGQDTVVFTFLDVPNIPQMGPDYHSCEGGMIVPVTAGGGARGGHFAFMLVDNDVAITAGREIWGYPKKLADVRMRRVSDDEITARATHHPFRQWNTAGALQVRVRLDGSADGLWDGMKSFEPRILSRRVRSPKSGRPEGWALLAVEGRTVRVHERASGSATLDIGASPQEGLDQLGPLDVLGALYTRCDFVLDYGTPLRP